MCAHLAAKILLSVYTYLTTVHLTRGLSESDLFSQQKCFNLGKLQIHGHPGILNSLNLALFSVVAKSKWLLWPLFICFNPQNFLFCPSTVPLINVTSHLRTGWQIFSFPRGTVWPVVAPLLLPLSQWETKD